MDANLRHDDMLCFARLLYKMDGIEILKVSFYLKCPHFLTLVYHSILNPSNEESPVVISALCDVPQGTNLSAVPLVNSHGQVSSGDRKPEGEIYSTLITWSSWWGIPICKWVKYEAQKKNDTIA